MGNLILHTICCLHPCCLPGNMYCKKCGVSIEYYTEYKSIPNSCREHRFVESKCIDCLVTEEYIPDNCIHRWSD
jgi:hypothetical protein